jgi:Inner membrane component of T3SS, cytoplasmic domain
MDLVDVVILALRLALVLVLYLFLWFVVRSAWHALRSPARDASSVAARQSAERSPAAALRLVVLEPGDTELPPGQLLAVPDGATLGRSERAGLVLADSAVSAEHARVALRDGEWVVTDLGSTNGTRVNQALVQGEAALSPGDVVSLGNVRLKVAIQ